jgi:hypothetical protein
MPDKSNFTPDEWKLLLESVMMAGIAVSAAEPSGLWGLLKESFAEGNAVMTSKLDPGADALIKAVVADFETRRPEGEVHRQQARRDQSQVHRDAAAGWRDSRYQGARRRGRLQGLAAPDQPARCRSIQGGRVSWHRRRLGERSGERQRLRRFRVRSNWRHDPVPARSKQVVTGKSSAYG